VAREAAVSSWREKERREGGGGGRLGPAVKSRLSRHPARRDTAVAPHAEARQTRVQRAHAGCGGPRPRCSQRGSSVTPPHVARQC
jgi:hypothetical protein